MEKTFKNRKKRILAVILVLALAFTMTAVAHASWYGFVNDMYINSEGDTVLYDAEYTGANVGGDVWTYVDNSHIAFQGKPYTFYIQKKGWWFWQWDTVASETCYFGQQGTVKAYGVGDGRYRFVIHNDFIYQNGVYASKFESYSWD